jgi:hypothetical protein
MAVSWGGAFTAVLDQASVAVNIRPLVNTAAMNGSTISAMLRMGSLLLRVRNQFAFAT